MTRSETPEQIAPPRGRRIVAKAGIGLVACVVMLLLLELGLRVFAPQPFTYIDFGDVFIPDPDTGYRLRPGALQADGRIHVNSLGFRDREFPVEKPAGVFRILVLGDSCTFGAGELADVYTKVLERTLNEGRETVPRFEVLSVGVPGFGTDEELVWLKRAGLRLAPDLVILGFFIGNDVIENRELGEKVPVAGKLVSRAAAREYDTGIGRLRVSVMAVLHESHLFRLVRSRVTGIAVADDRGQHGTPTENTAFQENTQPMLDLYRDRLIMLAKKPPQWLEDGWTNTAALVREMAAVLAARGVPLVVLIIPDQFQVNPQLQGEMARELGKYASYLQLDLPQRRLTEICGSAGIAVIDVLQEFRVQGRERMLYYPQNAHWNAAGNALAGKLLASDLRERGLLPE